MSGLTSHGFAFPDSVAVVTGGASGIGRASALAFARAGADVVIADLDAEGAAAVAEEVEGFGRKARAIAGDISRREEFESMVRDALDWQGRIDLFFSNAGIAAGGPLDRVPISDWERAINVNLWPHIWVLPLVLPQMLERGSGYLLHTASAAGILGNPATAPYVVSKFGVVGLVESVAVACSGTGVGVSVVCPMAVATNLAKSAIGGPPEAEEAVAAERRAMAHMRLHAAGIQPEQVAEAIMEGVAKGSLYILPQPELLEIVRTKWANPDKWRKGMGALWRRRPEMLDPGAA